METFSINWYAIAVAAAVSFALGYLWFGRLFGKTWMKEARLTEEDREKADPSHIYGYGGAFQFVIAYCLATFFAFAGIEATAITGALYGFLFGFGWVALSIGVIALQELRSWRYVWITGGFWTLSFTLMGLVIGAWQ